MSERTSVEINTHRLADVVAAALETELVRVGVELLAEELEELGVEFCHAGEELVARVGRRSHRREDNKPSFPPPLRLGLKIRRSTTVKLSATNAYVGAVEELQQERVVPMIWFLRPECAIYGYWV